jgi:hypothetical protein
MKCPALYMYGQSGDNLPGKEGHLRHLSLTPDCLSINLICIYQFFCFNETRTPCKCYFSHMSSVRQNSCFPFAWTKILTGQKRRSRELVMYPQSRKNKNNSAIKNSCRHRVSSVEVLLHTDELGATNRVFSNSCQRYRNKLYTVRLALLIPIFCYLEILASV